VATLEDRAAAFRGRMLASLRRLGVHSDAVLAAMDRVPRHHFVERCWTVPPGVAWDPHAAQELMVDEDCADEVLAAVHDPEVAILTQLPLDGGQGTSSLSAPIIVGLMLAEMDLRPGLRVLEIGTGSGYNAALIAALVGDPALVTSLDIDEGLIARAAERLAREGLDGLDIRAVDGARGAPDRAPFDRIVATVGCVDIAPAWVAQLASDGQLLIPLEHGGMHPRVLLTKEAGSTALTGRFTGRSAFLRMLGSQGAHHLWPDDVAPRGRARHIALPTELALALEPSEDRAQHPLRRHWDLATSLAIRDQRAAPGVGLRSGTSAAYLRRDKVDTHGPDGPALAARLLALAAAWMDQGCPTVEAYALELTPRDGTPPPPSDAHGPWVIDRIDYRETVSLL
jgi:protein-L-isoaspartate(D-aspartate) O-methyltransferase